MKAISKMMFGGAAIAALVTAAPAAAQYYPSQGYQQGYQQGYGNNNVVGNILNSILGGQNYQQNDRYAIDMCVRATEARLNGYNGGYGSNYGQFGGYGNSGYNQGYNGARVTRITNVERRNNGLKVYGLARAGSVRGAYGNQGYGYGNQGYGARQLQFNCKVNFRGQVTDVDIDRRG